MQKWILLSFLIITQVISIQKAEAGLWDEVKKGIKIGGRLVGKLLILPEELYQIKKDKEKKAQAKINQARAREAQALSEINFKIKTANIKAEGILEKIALFKKNLAELSLDLKTEKKAVDGLRQLEEASRIIMVENDKMNELLKVLFEKVDLPEHEDDLDLWSADLDFLISTFDDDQRELLSAYFSQLRQMLLNDFSQSLAIISFLKNSYQEANRLNFDNFLMILASHILNSDERTFTLLKRREEKLEEMSILQVEYDQLQLHIAGLNKDHSTQQVVTASEINQIKMELRDFIIANSTTGQGGTYVSRAVDGPGGGHWEILP